MGDEWAEKSNRRQKGNRGLVYEGTAVTISRTGESKGRNGVTRSWGCPARAAQWE